MSHTYHRTKVDLNAQQNGISGGTLECQNPPLACVICEGGPKAIKRYIRLMLVRMKSATTCLQPQIQSDCHGNIEGTTDDEEHSSLMHHIDQEKGLRTSNVDIVRHFHCSAEGDSAQKGSDAKSHGIRLFQESKRR